MFFRPRIFPMLFVGLLALMSIGGIRQARYRNAYFDGYRAGQIATASELADAPAAEAARSANQSPYGAPGYDYHHHRGIGFFGFLFYLFFFGFLFKMMSRMAWGGRRHWYSHHHSGRHGPRDGRSAKERNADDDFTGFGPTYEM